MTLSDSKTNPQVFVELSSVKESLGTNSRKFCVTFGHFAMGVR